MIPPRLLDSRVDGAVEVLKPLGFDVIGNDGAAVAVNGLDDFVHTGKNLKFTWHAQPRKRKWPERCGGSHQPLRNCMSARTSSCRLTSLRWMSGGAVWNRRFPDRIAPESSSPGFLMMAGDSVPPPSGRLLVGKDTKCLTPDRPATQPERNSKARGP